ncbi:hypothetical protein VMCG_07447 [Cytospora schulzeri]|uniref:Heterokaryon incompatibility domain-containing protein n=1 Tax=Cytospora schulzeri TaxID=448051 RepID=A0A423W168_9PEZI|nr:hypothetical protein VMCG_07447 [Valsa malicola]
MLSPRILHFTDSELSWECAFTTRCECDPKPSRRVDSGIQRRDLKDSPGWSRILREYTGRHLTYAKDRLPALAGVAAEAQTFRPGVRYLSGLWEDDLPYCLAWYSMVPGRAKRIHPTTAPSWSWACLLGSIHPGGSYMTSIHSSVPSLVQTIVVDYPAMESNLYGSLPAGQRATLTATASLYDCRIVFWGQSHESTVVEVQTRRSDQEPLITSGYFNPDTEEDADTVRDGELAVLMTLFGVQYIVLRRLGECDCTFQRIGIYEGTELPPLEPGRKKRITII